MSRAGALGAGRSGPSREQVADVVRGWARVERPVGTRKPASVLFALTERDGELALVLTMRPRTMPTHAGQIAFPGGRVDAIDGDDRWATALRETEEEVGVPASAIERLGQLDDLVTVTGYHVTPMVGFVDPAAPLSPDPREVERAFTVPLHEFLDPPRRRVMRAIRPGLGLPKAFIPLTFYLTSGGVVWGVTAQMIAPFVRALERVQAQRR